MLRQLFSFHIFAVLVLSLPASVQSASAAKSKVAYVRGGDVSLWSEPGYTWRDCEQVDNYFDPITNIASPRKIPFTENDYATGVLNNMISPDNKKFRERMFAVRKICESRSLTPAKEGQPVYLAEIDGKLESQEFAVPNSPDEKRLYYRGSININGKTEIFWIEAGRLTEPEDPLTSAQRRRVEKTAADTYRAQAARMAPKPTPAPLQSPAPPQQPAPPQIIPVKPTPANPTCPDKLRTPPPLTSLQQSATDIITQIDNQSFGEELTNLKNDEELRTFACLYERPNASKSFKQKFTEFLTAAIVAEDIFGFPKSMMMCKVLLESSMHFNPNDGDDFKGYGQFGTDLITDLGECSYKDANERYDYMDSNMRDKYLEYQRQIPGSQISSLKVRKSDDPASTVLAIALSYQLYYGHHLQGRTTCSKDSDSAKPTDLTRKEAYLMYSSYNRGPKSLPGLMSKSLQGIRSDKNTPDETINYYQAMDNCMAKGQFREFRPPYDGHSQEFKDRCVRCGLTDCSLK